MLLIKNKGETVRPTLINEFILMIKISEIIITFKGLFGVNFKNFFKKFKKI